MCGIYGVVGTYDEDPFKSAGIKMLHRGPDSCGEYHFNNVHLGHRRLSIIDLDPRSNQPMKSSDGNLAIVFNGEIYNFIQLKEELSEYNYKTTSDTEVILAAIQSWGIDKTLTKLRGMFAFACLDVKLDKLFIARDHVGKKPLYYYSRGKDFVFSSTLNSLKELVYDSLEINDEAVNHYFIRSYIPSPLSIYKGVKKLSPGSYLELDLDSGDIGIESFWKPVINHHAQGLKEAEVLSKTKDLLIQSVKRRLISDVPLGAFLSGGIDSSLVSAIITKELNKDLKTFTIGFSDPKYNESDIAQETSKILGTEHMEYKCDDLDSDIVETILDHYGEPFGDHSALPTYILAKHAKSEITVALSGDGGDEGFAGYNSHLALKYGETVNHIFGNSLTMSLFKPLSSLNKKAKWISQLNSKKEGWYAFDPMGDKGFRTLSDKLFNTEVIPKVDKIENDFWRENNQLSWLERGQLLGIITTLPDGLMTKSDVSTMAWSLESRAPLLDVDLLEFGLNIDQKFKINGNETKYVLRKLLKDYLPEEITKLPKKGFSFPLKTYLYKNREAITELVNVNYQKYPRVLNAQYCKKYINDFYSKDIGKPNHVWLIYSFYLWLSKNQ